MFMFCFCDVAGIIMVFLSCVHTLLNFAAMIMVFYTFSCFCWYVYCLFDVFAHLVRFRCYVHGLVDVSLDLLVCSWVV
jgi:hypothetical protein